MAEINMLTLIQDTFYYLDNGGSPVDESDVYFFHRCVLDATWKDKAEAEGVLEKLVEIADHVSVAHCDADDIHKALLSSIVTVAKAARKLGQPS